MIKKDGNFTMKRSRPLYSRMVTLCLMSAATVWFASAAFPALAQNGRTSSGSVTNRSNAKSNHRRGAVTKSPASKSTVLKSTGGNFSGARSSKNPRGSQSDSLHFQERKSENPPRFVFAPKTEPTSGAPWEKDPSAGAIWSTFLTGNISPELVEWHVNQRKKVQYEKIASARRQRIGMTDESVALAGRPGAGSSEYGGMLGRMEFSLASHHPLEYDGEFLSDPSGGAILLQLLTGYKNMEMTGWKEGQIALARRQQSEIQAMDFESEEGLPFQEGRQVAAFSGPYPDGQAVMNGTGWDENRFLSENVSRPMSPRRPFSPTMPTAVAETSPIPNRSLNGDSSERTAVFTASADDSRFVDDRFPLITPTATSAVSSAGYRSVNSDPSAAVRPVSAEISTPTAPQAPRFLAPGETVDRPGQIKVYHSVPHENQMSPLPENGAAVHDEGWNPVE